LSLSSRCADCIAAISGAHDDDDDDDDSLNAYLAVESAHDARDAQLVGVGVLGPERSNPKRVPEDTLDLPPLGWKMPRPILMEDGADAAGAAIKVVWPEDVDKMMAMCNIHVQRLIKNCRGELVNPTITSG